MALATSAKMRPVDAMLKLEDLGQYFSALVCADDVSSHKPAADCYVKACKKNSASPHQTLVIEDSSNGATAAQSVGFRVVTFHGSMWKHDAFAADDHIQSFLKLSPLPLGLTKKLRTLKHTPD